MQYLSKLINSIAEESPEKGFRFTVNGIGLLNNQVLDRSKLTDDEEFELVELMDFGLRQPIGVSNATFLFTSEGILKHKRLLKLLTKCAKGKVKKETILYSAKDIVWKSDDGQIAIKNKGVGGA